MSSKISFTEILINRAKSLKSKVDGQTPKFVVLTEGQDPRVQAAAILLQEQGIARVKLLFSSQPNQEIISKLGTLEVTTVQANPKLPIYSAELFDLRKSKGLSESEAANLLNNTLYFGAFELKHQACDACVSGAINTTADVIRSGLQVLGKRQSSDIISSFFLMILADGKLLTYADCGVVPCPDAKELAQIALNAAHAHQVLTQQTPKVALLSFSTLGSAKHECLNKISQTKNLLRQMAPELLVDGELQFDAAFVEEVAKRKAPDSQVAGHANVYIFPDLNSGNIAYKITERLAGATAIGPVLQGLNLPWMDLSRGCKVEDIVLVAAIACILGEN